MYPKERLVRGEGYWMETIQQSIYEALLSYMDKHDLNQTQLAEKLGFTRGYVSQLMNGNFNLSQKKIIQLLLKMDMVPDLRIRSVEDYLAAPGTSAPHQLRAKKSVDPSKVAAASKERAVPQRARRSSAE